MMKATMRACLKADSKMVLLMRTTMHVTALNIYRWVYFMLSNQLGIGVIIPCAIVNWAVTVMVSN